MKRTDTLLTLNTGEYISKDGRKMLEGFKMVFNLSQEDMNIVQNQIAPLCPNDDLADVFLAMLTYGIHTAYKDVTGEEFVYPYERTAPKGNKKA